jgi:hypothetical protein
MKLQHLSRTGIDTLSAPRALALVKPVYSHLAGRQYGRVLVYGVHWACVRTPAALYTDPQVVLIRVFQIDNDPSLLWIHGDVVCPRADRLAAVARDTDIIVFSEPGHNFHPRKDILKTRERRVIRLIEKKYEDHPSKFFMTLSLCLFGIGFDTERTEPFS